MKINNLQKSIFLTTILSLIVSVAHAKGGVNLKGVPALITSTYIFALIFAGVFLLLAAIVSNAIKFQGGENPRDAFKRRMWFWIFAILGPVSFFIYNILYLDNISRFNRGVNCSTVANIYNSINF